MYRKSRFWRRAVRKFERQRPFKLTPYHLLSTYYGTPSRFDRSATHMAMPAPPTWPRTPYHPRGCHSFRVAVRGRAPPWAASPRRADPHAPRARPVGRAPARSAPAQHRSVDPTAVPHRMQWAMREPLDAAFVPTGHLASRVSGIPDDADDARREMAWRGVSNYHRDPKDAWRRFSP